MALDWRTASEAELPDVWPPIKICVFGAGSFGTAMGFIAAQNKHHVILLTRTTAHADEINALHQNAKYLPTFRLPDNVTATSDPATALAGVDLIIHAIPVQATPAFLDSVKQHIPAGVPIVSTSKGILTTSHDLMCDIFPKYVSNPTLYLSGPSFAKELMRLVPTSVAIASTDQHALNFTQRVLRSRFFRVYCHNDVVGLELAGACKNVVALIAGYIVGADLGANTQAGVITLAFNEVVRLGEVMGANLVTFLGLAGLGDLLLTCTSSQSRNFTVGMRLGRGETIPEILASSTQVAEGVASAAPIRQLILERGLGPDTMPILCCVADVVSGKTPPADAVRILLDRPARPEVIASPRVHYDEAPKPRSSRLEPAAATTIQ